MSKRRVGDQLTGGTRDVNPQYMQGAVVMTTINQAKEETIGVPIVRPGGVSAGNKAVIVELLKLWVMMPGFVTNAGANNTAFARTFSLSTSAQTTVVPNLSDGRVLAQFIDEYIASFTAAGTAGVVAPRLKCWDFTDGAGHGILVGTDNLYLQGDTDNFAAVATFTYKIEYRFKEVSLVEYIGIVQSQQ